MKIGDIVKIKDTESMRAWGHSGKTGEDMTLEQQLELEFRRGYYAAVANLVRTHDQSTIAADVLRAYGHVNFRGIDPGQSRVLRPIAVEIKRKDKLDL
jgi:hypothetical protein